MQSNQYEVLPVWWCGGGKRARDTINRTNTFEDCNGNGLVAFALLRGHLLPEQVWWQKCTLLVDHSREYTSEHIVRPLEGMERRRREQEEDSAIRRTAASSAITMVRCAVSSFYDLYPVVFLSHPVGLCLVYPLSRFLSRTTFNNDPNLETRYITKNGFLCSFSRV